LPLTAEFLRILFYATPANDNCTSTSRREDDSAEPSTCTGAHTESVAMGTDTNSEDSAKRFRRVRRGSATFVELNLEDLLEDPGELVCDEAGCPEEVLSELQTGSEENLADDVGETQESPQVGAEEEKRKSTGSQGSRTSTDSAALRTSKSGEISSMSTQDDLSTKQSATSARGLRGLPPASGRSTPSPRNQNGVRISQSHDDLATNSSRGGSGWLLNVNRASRNSADRERSSHPITEAVRSKSGDNRFADIFQLPHTQRLVDHFSCGLQKAIILQGTLYLFKDYVCFRSIVLAGTKIVMPIRDIVRIQRERNLLIDNAIRFTLQDGSSYLFVSFLFPARVYREFKESGLFAPEVFEDRPEAERKPMTRSPRDQRSKDSATSGSASPGDQQSESKSGNSITDEEDEGSEDDEEYAHSVEQSMVIRLFAIGNLPYYPHGKKHLLQSDQSEMTKVCSVTLPCNNARLFRAFFLDLKEEEALHQSIGLNQINGTNSESKANGTNSKSEIPTKAKASDSGPGNAASSESRSSESDALVFSARNNFLAFQAKLGHQDMQLGEWHLDPDLGFVREFRYRKPLEPAPMSPKETWMTEHMLFYVSKQEREKLQTIYLEIKGTSHDVPFGDSFVAEQLYVFRPASENGRFECELEIYGGVHFSRWNMVAGTIRKRTIAGVEHTANVFVQMARELCTTSLCRRVRDLDAARYRKEIGASAKVLEKADTAREETTEDTSPTASAEIKPESISLESLPLPTRYMLLPFYRIALVATSATCWDATLLSAFLILCITLLTLVVFRLYLNNQQLTVELRHAEEQVQFLRSLLKNHLGP